MTVMLALAAWTFHASAQEPLTTVPVEEQAPAKEPEAKAEDLSFELEDVVVVARRRNENLQRTPVAVTAVSAEDLKAFNMDSVEDVTSMVPGLDRYEGRKEADYSIRGVGRARSTDLSLDPSVGVYIDGIYLPRQDSQLLDALDVESIQVLRGPQGTLFGKNSIGGAIIVRTREPRNRLRMGVDTEFGSFRKRAFQFSADVPLFSDAILTRFAVAKKKSDGFARDIDGDQYIGDDNSESVIGQVSLQPLDNVNLRLLAHYSNQNEHVEPYNCQLTNTDGLVVSARAPGNPQSYEEACLESEALLSEGLVNRENFGLTAGARQLLLGATVRAELPLGELTSITTYSDRGESTSSYDIDGTDVLLLLNSDYVNNFFLEEGLLEGPLGTRSGWSQELQLNGQLFDKRVDYTGGLFVASEKFGMDVGGQFLTPEGYIGLTRLPGLPSAPPGFVYVVATALGGLGTSGNMSYAGFVQASIDVTSDLQLTLGTRYTYEERKRTSQSWSLADSVPPLFPGLPGIPDSSGIPLILMTDAQFDSIEGTRPELAISEPQSGHLKFSNVSSMASLAWSPTDRVEIPGVSSLMLYYTIAQGFKAGGFTSRFGQMTTFKPERLLSNEVGLKSELFSRRVRFNLAAYNSDYQDMQIFVVQFDAAQGGSFSTTNAGKSIIRGAELELQLVVTQNLFLSVTSSFNDAQFKKYDDFAVNLITGAASPIDRKDEPFPFIPRWTHSFALSYHLDTDSIGNFNFTALTSFRDEIFMGQDYKAGLPEFVDRASAGSYWVTGVRLGWNPPGHEEFKLFLSGSNVFDREYIAWGVAVTDNLGTNGVIRGQPRAWGFGMSYEFAAE